MIGASFVHGAVHGAALVAALAAPAGRDAPPPFLPVPVEREAEAPLEAPPPAEPEAPAEAAPAAAPVDEGEMLDVIPATADSRPYAKPEDLAALRRRHGLDPSPPTTARTARWKCWIADPTCGFSVEVNATSAYAYRLRQGSVERPESLAWSSARVQYDLWINIPAVVETHGKFRYTRMTLGPKGGVIASDDRSMWGNFGVAGRYWFGRGRLAPTLEFSGALAFMLYGGERRMDTGTTYHSLRSPIGITADVGVGLGGYGALILGGQYDAALAREDIGDAFRIPAGGMFFIGFRGNIAWGAPAAIAVATHATVLRAVTPP